MRRVVIVQYGLMAAAWGMAAAAWPMRAVEFNRFLGWQGKYDTAAFLRFLFEQPRVLMREQVETLLLHKVWLGLVLAGFAVFVFGVALVRRRMKREVARGIGMVLLVFPLAVVAPVSWHLPRPLGGMYLLAAAHVVMFAAIWMTPGELKDHDMPTNGLRTLSDPNERPS